MFRETESAFCEDDINSIIETFAKLLREWDFFFLF